MRSLLPEYEYLYLGDNARAPYGTRSFEVIYEYTLQAVQYLHDCGCRLVILACNTASAKALRTIQQNDLPRIWQQDGNDSFRVLGVIRPTVEALTSSGHQHVGILATQGTVGSGSYVIELQHLAPHIVVTQQACPMLVPLIENHEIESPATDYFVEQYVRQLFEQDSKISSIILGCTHYPLLADRIASQAEAYCPDVQIISQGTIVAESLRDYFLRHPDMAARCSRGGGCTYLTTESAERFAETARLFLDDTTLSAHHTEL